MPCRDGRDDYGRITIEYRDDPETKRRLDEATSNLCSLLKRLKRSYAGVYVGVLDNDRELAAWWKRHQEEDRRRELREKAARDEKQARRKAKKLEDEAKAKALNKLTAAERKLLNL